MRRFFWATALLATMGAPMVRACDVALALTVDVSGSIDPNEYKLQMDGLAQALDHSVVADALIAANAKVAVLLWSGASRQELTIGWRDMSDLAAVAALASDVRAAPRPWRHFSTAIGEMLHVTSSLFDQVSCKRMVIDVSGDGISNEGQAPDIIRDILVARGIRINALAILGATGEDLPAYFRDHVIGGENAFVYSATGYDDYPRAIRRKLLDEVTEPVS